MYVYIIIPIIVLNMKEVLHFTPSFLLSFEEGKVIHGMEERMHISTS